MAEKSQEMGEHLSQLLETYFELNSTKIDELDSLPSGLEFMRYVAQNRPFVVRGGCRYWTAVERWDAQYLKKVVGDHDVNVAITPLGPYAKRIPDLLPSNADSVILMPDGSLSFVKPLERTERFRDVLDFISNQELHDGPQEPIKYAQTHPENDNLRGEYASLFQDVPTEIDFARIALQKEPDAVNLWLGNSRSVTAMHKDNYENVYAQIRGKKHFVLLPPVAAPCVNEQALPGSTYAQNLQSLDSWEIQLDQPVQDVPVTTWDPDVPMKRSTPYSSLAQPMRVTLDPGDMLYLPAMWYHKVSQSCGSEGFCCAVNYWYDMEFGGSFWATNAFIRDVSNAHGR